MVSTIFVVLGQLQGQIDKDLLFELLLAGLLDNQLLIAPSRLPPLAACA